MNYIVLISIWVAFAAVHSLLITPRLEQWVVSRAGRYAAFYRLGYNLIAVVTFGLALAFTKRMDTQQVYTIPPLLQVILGLFALLLMAWAFFCFDSLEFLGVRQVLALNSSRAEDQLSQPLLKTGLYRYVRHPMYLGALIFLWSLNATVAELLMKLILTGYLFVGASLEEEKLIKTYGDSYRAYQKEVAMLLPLANNKAGRVVYAVVLSLLAIASLLSLSNSRNF